MSFSSDSLQRSLGERNTEPFTTLVKGDLCPNEYQGVTLEVVFDLAQEFVSIHEDVATLLGFVNDFHATRLVSVSRHCFSHGFHDFVKNVARGREHEAQMANTRFAAQCPVGQAHFRFV